jgi:hypothetical protein
MEERVPGGRERRRSGRFRGSKREILFGRILPPLARAVWRANEDERVSDFDGDKSPA